MVLSIGTVILVMQMDSFWWICKEVYNLLILVMQLRLRGLVFVMVAARYRKMVRC